MKERKLPVPVTTPDEYLAAILEELVECHRLLGALVPTQDRPEVGASQAPEPAPVGPPAKKKRRKKR